MKAKQFVSFILLTSILTPSFATDGNDRINFSIQSTENRIFYGSILQKIEDYSGDYLPPIANDLAVYVVKAVASGVTDGSLQTLDQDIQNYAQERIERMDFSIFNPKGASTDEFLIRSRFLAKNIENLGIELKKMVPETKHSTVDGMISLAERKLNDFRLEFLAHQLKKNQSESEYVTSQLFKELVDKLAKTNKSSALDQRIEALTKELEELKQAVNSSEQEKKLEDKQKEIDNIKAIKQAQFQQNLQDISHIGNGIAAIVGISDPKAAQLIATTNSSILQILGSADALSSASGLAAFGQYALIASASVQLLQAWGVFGGKKKDGVGEALREISKQIQRLQERMDSRFDRIENQLYQNHKEILRNFAAINSSINSLDVTLTATYKKVTLIEERIKQTHVQDDLKRALFYIENELEPIDRRCLSVVLTKVEAANCLKLYEEFIKINSQSIVLTKVGNAGEWNKYIEWQINYYGEELGANKRLSNLSVLEGVESRLAGMLKKNASLNLTGFKEFVSLQGQLRTRKNEISSLVSQEKIDETVESVNQKIEDIRGKVSETMAEEFQKTPFSEYLKELKSLKSEYEKAIDDRVFEINQLRRNDFLAERYRTDLQTTIGALRSSQKQISTVLSYMEKNSWTKAINDPSLNLPVIVKPRNAASSPLRPFVLSKGRLKELLGDLNLSSVTTVSNLALEYDFSASSNYVELTTRPSDLASGFGNEARSSAAMVPVLQYKGFISVNLTGLLKVRDAEGISKDISVLQLSDKNTACSGGRRRAAWFKNAIDPYSMSHIIVNGFYSHVAYKESCPVIFKNVANSESSRMAINKEKDLLAQLDQQVLSNIQTQVLKGATKTLASDGTLELCNSLQNDLGKLKGLIYLKHKEMLGKDLEQFKRFVSINGQNVMELLNTQLEYIIYSGKGRVLSDVALAAMKWESTAMDSQTLSE